MIFYYCLAIFFEKFRIMYYRHPSLRSGSHEKMYKRTAYRIGRLNNLYIFAPSK